jgi:hypothetical protein
MNNKTTLSTGKYTIDLEDKGFSIYTTDASGQREWVASAADPQVAMNIVEGLIMVEIKRFYHPESAPQLKVEEEKKASPPFLKVGD